MDSNSVKPVDTREAQVSALQIVRNWVNQEGGRGRIPTALVALLEATSTAVARADPPPEKDGATLLEVWRLDRGSGDDPASPLRGAEVDRWWQARAEHIRQACVAQRCQWEPRLIVRTGGGRHLPTVYAFELIAIGDRDLDVGPADEPSSALPRGGLQYRIDPVTPAWWFRVVIGSRPFAVNSWRGYVLLGSAALNFALIGLIWLGIYIDWSRGRPLTSADLALCAIALVVSAVLWATTRPVRLLPMHRVTIANEAFISFGTMHGQLRTMREGRSKLARRVFSLVRHWGVCPACAAEVDLAEGGAAFPDRLVGRCNDAPLEHVFSFDPVRLVGAPLRQDTLRS